MSRFRELYVAEYPKNSREPWSLFEWEKGHVFVTSAQYCVTTQSLQLTADKRLSTMQWFHGSGFIFSRIVIINLAGVKNNYIEKKKKKKIKKKEEENTI